MMEGMCPSCLHQRALSAHAVQQCGLWFGGELGAAVGALEVSTAREKVSGGKECTQGGPSAIARGTQGREGGKQGDIWDLDAVVGK